MKMNETSITHNSSMAPARFGWAKRIPGFHRSTCSECNKTTSPSPTSVAHCELDQPPLDKRTDDDDTLSHSRSDAHNVDLFDHVNTGENECLQNDRSSSNDNWKNEICCDTCGRSFHLTCLRDRDLLELTSDFNGTGRPNSARLKSSKVGSLEAKEDEQNEIEATGENVAGKGKKKYLNQGYEGSSSIGGNDSCSSDGDDDDGDDSSSAIKSDEERAAENDIALCRRIRLYLSQWYDELTNLL